MRNIPGWVAGALGVGTLVGAFYLGGRTASADAPSLLETGSVAATSAMPAADAASELAVECEAGQRAVVRTVPGAAATVACVSEARPVAARRPTDDGRYSSAAPSAAIVRVADGDDRPYARPAVLAAPTEVYRPRSRPASRQTAEVDAPARSVSKSVLIIASSTVAGAVMGGVVKGKKGAVVGGIVGGGAATVWDQVTRRQREVR